MSNDVIRLKMGTVLEQANINAAKAEHRDEFEHRLMGSRRKVKSAQASFSSIRVLHDIALRPAAPIAPRIEIQYLVTNLLPTSRLHIIFFCTHIYQYQLVKRSSFMYDTSTGHTLASCSRHGGYLFFGW
jgi:hypothetical protein